MSNNNNMEHAKLLHARKNNNKNEPVKKKNQPRYSKIDREEEDEKHKNEPKKYASKREEPTRKYQDK